MHSPRLPTAATRVLLASLTLVAAVVISSPPAAASSSGVGAISAGGYHTCALMTTGGVKCWGENYYGDLGDGTMHRRLTPVDVSGLSSAVAGVSAGWDYTCALMDTGGVKCWGYNYEGELGDGTTTIRTTPVDVSGLSSGVEAISADGHHTCALMATGGVKCWGENDYGQLGDGTTKNRTTPVDVSGLSSGVAAVSAFGDHTCALMDTGGVKCWGDNGDGQLGDGTTHRRLTPVDVSGLSSSVLAVTAGGVHTCALMVSGGVKCWGWNGVGQLGDGTRRTRTTPVDVSGLSSGVGAISAGSDHTCSLMVSGGAKCWGWNSVGEVGDGTTTTRTTPVDVSGLSSGVAAISAGAYHTCALMDTGGAKCWGDNAYGDLGDGTQTLRTTPVRVVFPGPDVLVKRSTDTSYRGEGVFNATGAWQSVRSKVSRGASASFSIQIQNESTSTDSFLAKGCGDSPGFSVRYWAGSANVTSAVVSGSYATGTLAPSEQAFLSAKVSVRSTATVGDVKSCLLTVISQASPSKEDAVGFKVEVTA
jgi:alpha-tubulin suppressor-like RCC1 family protein